MERPDCQRLISIKSSCRLACKAVFATSCLLTHVLSAQEQVASVTPRTAEKRIIGPTTIVAEANSDLNFKARVDTGATTTSVHVEEWAIEDESEKMEENVGKKIRFRMKNHKGESQWLDSRVEEIALVKTSKLQETRYKVRLTLVWNDVTKHLLVTLNDRSHMEYPMLLGRNFLEGDFVVDVDLHKTPKPESTSVEDGSSPGDK